MSELSAGVDSLHPSVAAIISTSKDVNSKRKLEVLLLGDRSDGME